MSDAIEQRPSPESPRPSRQDLVVPPRQSHWTVVIGGIASSLAGFGLVFGLGLGRSRHPVAEHVVPAVAAIATESADPLAETPRRLPPAAFDDVAASTDELLPPQPVVSATGFQPDEAGSRTGGSDFQSADIAPPAPSRFGPPSRFAADRYPAQPVSHDTPAADAEPLPRTSRYASPDLPPLDAAPAADPFPATAGPPMADARPTSGSADMRESVAEPAVEAIAEVAASPDIESALPIDPRPEAAASGAVPPAVADLAAVDSPQVAASLPPVEPEPAIDESLPEPEAVEPPANPFVQTPPTPLHPSAALPAGEASSPSFSPEQAMVAASESSTGGMITPATATVVEAAAAAAAETMPFAAAPPLGPAGPLAAAPAVPTAPFARTEPAAAAGQTGQGVPGPLQLEGVQTPQLAVEKRGPKEIQVGKPARYEILVRNVGSATAHEVVLRDSVPRGTSLIATTPPATPVDGDTGPAAGDLVWALGVLPPGGEARVLTELMPMEEGEIGSIASVSFRADATLRSRSTKPALVIDCPEPDAVRIGHDMQVTLTVSNPGSGTATGVVLEAFLPETVSHRAGSELEFDVGQLRPGDSKTIELVLGTRSPGLQPTRLIARADGGIEETLQVPLEVTAPTLELAIEMPVRRFLQRPATCRIAMVNAGTASARAVELAAQLPPGMKFVRANNAGWHDERTHRVLWNLEELPAGETGTVEAVVMPVQPGPQRITAAARSTDGPSAQVDHQCTVEGLAALSFQVLDSEDPIEVDGLTEYVIRVSNDGTKAATGVRVAATLLGDLEPVEATGPGGHRVENLAVEFEPLAKLAPGEEAVYRVRARGHRAGDQRVQVQLVSEDHPTPITKEEITSVYDDR